MKNMFDTQYGKENVNLNSLEQTFQIKNNSQMVAIQENGAWYFLESKKDQIDFLEMVLGEEVVKKLNLRK